MKSTLLQLFTSLSENHMSLGQSCTHVRGDKIVYETGLVLEPK